MVGPHRDPQFSMITYSRVACAIADLRLHSMHFHEHIVKHVQLMGGYQCFEKLDEFVLIFSNPA